MAADDATITDLLQAVNATRGELARADDARQHALAELRKDVEAGSKSVTEVTAKIDRISAAMAADIGKLQAAMNALSTKVGRPTAGMGIVVSEETEARALCESRYRLRVPKFDAAMPFSPADTDIDDAMNAIRGIRRLFKAPAGIEQLGPAERKGLSSFNLGSSGFILPPEMSSTVLSCLTDASDMAGVVGSTTISGPSIKFLIDNADLDIATWACDVDCWSANRVADITRGLGEAEIKPESLRYIVCASRDLLEDASVDIESWTLAKVNRAVRNTISAAIMTGDGLGKPQGILQPGAGIPICDTSDATPAGQFTWQDLIMLKWMVPMQFHANGGSYLMNQDTFARALTMSDTTGRPIMIASPTQAGTFLINGSPVTIATQMPSVAPGATPVAFGNWRLVYMLVNRRAVTMQQDPYSAGFCVLFKFEARVGGGIICPNAARLMRIH